MPRAALLTAVLVVSVLGVTSSVSAEEPQLAHMVFFTLKERTPEQREKLATFCRKYLDKHEGTVYFSVGTRGEEFKRDVNEQDWDVALHLVFKDKAAHDVYQTHPRHLEFIKNAQDLWAKVRVFDSYVPAAK
jgi:quinol monooxygenase YgiN